MVYLKKKDEDQEENIPPCVRDFTNKMITSVGHNLLDCNLSGERLLIEKHPQHSRVLQFTKFDMGTPNNFSGK